MIATLLTLARPSADDYYTTTTDSAYSAGVVVFLLLVYLLMFAVAFVVAGLMWAGVFKKAGFAKWKAFVPFYNTWILVKIAGRPESHFWLQFIPYAGLYWSICTLNDISKSFGKDTAYTVGLVFIPVVFASILSYGDAQYRGPSYMTAEQKMYAQNYGQQYGVQYPGQAGAPQQYGAPTYAAHVPAQQAYGQQAYGQQPYGQAPAQPQYGAPQAQPPYGAPQYGQPADPNQPYGQQDPNAQNQNPYGSGPAQ
ncbi:DUF5684 domain-containing protein [Arthrobacter sp. GMC3]|uniref:DUF5684 domain-containing protein n=1 Tax=Arthrobacter sp. GMC3 TaxID=2058894 RepID=UPI000CE3A8FE|nr:DUF5684 domain-containing protein [Arthrobacter sp. GMC3]